MSSRILRRSDERYPGCHDRACRRAPVWVAIEDVAALLTHCREPKPYQHPVNVPVGDDRQPRHSPDLELLHADKVWQALAKSRVLLKQQRHHFLEVGA